MTNEKRGHIYSLGALPVDGHERLLFKADREIPITPKVFDTLLALIENSSHVLTKKELMQKVWPDSFVEENNLAQNVSRKALGESLIQTIPNAVAAEIGACVASEARAGEVLVSRTVKD